MNDAVGHRPMPFTLHEVQALFVRRVWIALAIYVLVGLPLVWWRRHQLGTAPVAVLPQTVFAVSALLSVILRHRLPPTWYRGLPPALLMLGGLLGLGASGLQGTGYGTVIFACVCAMTIYEPRLALVVMGVGWVGVVAIGAAYVGGMLPLRFGVEAARNPVSWLVFILHMGVLNYYLLGVAGAYQRSIVALLREVERQRDRIAQLANHDALTGLPTLRLARDRLDQACREARRQGGRAAALFIDLDGFKAVNDGHGHEAGDAVLKAIAARLGALMRQSDTIARLGGDEFLVVLGGVADAEAALAVARKIVDTVALPVVWGEARLGVGASVGVALYPDHGADIETLLRHADRAMYSVKQSGKRAAALFVA